MGLDILEELDGITAALDARGIPYALCGGIAVNVHGHIRSTRDIDLLVRRESVASVLEAVEPLGFTLPAGPIPFGVGTEQFRELHRVSKVDGPTLLTLDLLVVTPVFEDVWNGRQLFAWRGRPLPVVSREGLEKMKRLAGRHQDLADLENLDRERDDGP